MVGVEEQLVELEDEYQDVEPSLSTEDDALVSPGTFGFASSTSTLTGHDVSDDRRREQAIRDLLYHTCRHTYMSGVLFNDVDYRLRLENATNLVIVISSYSVSQNLGPLISKNAPKKGWGEGTPCFAMGMIMPLYQVLEDSGRSVISIDPIEGSHQAGAFDHSLPPHLAITATAYARQIVELANRGNVELIGQGQLVNDLLKGAIKANRCVSTIKFIELAHPTNMSTNFSGNRKALANADLMNTIFKPIRGKVNWAGLVLDIGPRSDKYNGKGGVLGSIIGDRYIEFVTGIPTAKPHINVVVCCDELGIYDDNDDRLISIVGHLDLPHSRTALYLHSKGNEGGINSHKTDPNCEQGEHLMNNGEVSMPTLERVTKGGLASLGSQRTLEPFMLLERVLSTKVPGATSVSKFTQNQADVGAVLVKEQFFNKLDRRSRGRISEYKEA